jgi:hypothetical protein
MFFAEYVYFNTITGAVLFARLSFDISSPNINKYIINPINGTKIRSHDINL